MKILLPLGILFLLLLLPSTTSAAVIINRPNYLGLDHGLVGYWSFDGGDMNKTYALDSSGQGNSGTLTNGPTRVIGKIGQALEFDGSNDEVDAGSAAVLDNLDPLTYAAWIRINSFPAADEAVIVSKSGGSTSGKSCEVDNRGGANGDNTLALVVPRATTDTKVIAIDNALSVSTWYHITCVFDSAGTSKLYINGAEPSLGTNTQGAGGVSAEGTPSLLIGARDSGPDTKFFDGSIDDVRVYNRVLSAVEIQRLYNMGGTFKINKTNTDTLREGLVGHWSFDGTDMSQSTHNVWAIDRSEQGNNGQLNNTATSSVRVIGKIGQALDFDGSDDFVLVDTSPISARPYTLCAWFYSRSLTVSQAVVMVGADTTSGGNIKTASSLILAGATAGDPVQAHDRATTDSGTASAASASAYKINTWQHACAVFVSTTERHIYLDGKSEGSSTASAGPASWGRAVIGQREQSGTSDQPMDGLIDDVRIYNRVLSADEIRRLYNMGGTFKINKTNTDTLREGLVGHWSFDGGDMSQSTNNVWSIDRSGQGNNGRLVNTATSSARVEGRIGQALSFDGSDDYVNLGDPVSVTGHLTISVWIKLNSDYTSTQSIISNNASNNGTNASYHLEYGRTDKRIIFKNNNAALDITGNTDIANNDWHHVVIKRTGATGAWILELFLDGTTDKTQTAVIANPVDSTNNASIGRAGQADLQYFNGNIDDLRVYNYALSAGEIRRLYNMGR